MSGSKQNSFFPPACRRWIAVALLSLAVGVTVLAGWLAGVTVGHRDPVFLGQAESEWIKNLKYYDDEQVKEWRGYGEAGVQVLIRGLEQANRPGERAYRRLYRRSPGVIMRWLPAPKPDSTRASRMTLVSLLSSLGNDATSATPIMIRTLNGDEDASVRQIAIGFFTGNEDAKCPLNQMTAAERARLLPVLLRSLQDGSDWGLRNNAANALRYFPEQRAVVAPALVTALQDPQPHVRLLAAKALNHIDPATARQAGAVRVVGALVAEPDDQIASQAACALRDFQSEPEFALPALIQGLDSSNSLVACQSVWTLQQFAHQTNVIIPALEKAAGRTNAAARYAQSALKQFSQSVRIPPGAK